MKQALHNFVKEIDLDEVVILIYANKQDMPDAIPVNKVRDAMRDIIWKDQEEEKRILEYNNTKEFMMMYHVVQK